MECEISFKSRPANVFLLEGKCKKKITIETPPPLPLLSIPSSVWALSREGPEDHFLNRGTQGGGGGEFAFQCEREREGSHPFAFFYASQTRPLKCNTVE